MVQERVVGAPRREDRIITDADYGGLTEVSFPSQYPWRMNVRLAIRFPDGSGGTCSGALIDSKHVLTAGHCVYNRDRGGWASSIQVVPGYDPTDTAPYGTARMIDAMSWSGWTSRGDWGDDMANTPSRSDFVALDTEASSSYVRPGQTFAASAS